MARLELWLYDLSFPIHEIGMIMTVTSDCHLRCPWHNTEGSVGVDWLI